MSPSPRYAVACVYGSLDYLGSSTNLLLILALFVNAAAQPYAGFFHDARLYAAQVLNRINGGLLADDLFFRFGSQDRYSIFSLILDPISRLAGIEWAFFTLFLLSTAAFFWALVRCVQTLTGHPAATAIGILHFAAAPSYFGAYYVFRVHEPFLTPRIAAAALVLFGLERALRARWIAATLGMVAAMLLHPIIASPGVVALAGFYAVRTFPIRRVAFAAVILAILLALALWLTPTAFGKIFGSMDSSWLETVRQATPYMYPEEWSLDDWIPFAAVIGIGVVAGWRMLRSSQIPAGTLLFVLGAVAILGVAAAGIAGRFGYALPFQAQTYRFVWIITALQGPLLAWLALRALDGSLLHRLAAVVVLAWFVKPNFFWIDYLLPAGWLLVVLPVIATLLRKRPVRDWLPVAVAISILLGALTLSILSLRAVFWGPQPMTTAFEKADVLRFVLRLVSPAVWITAAGAVGWWWMRSRRRWAPAVLAASLTLAAHTGGFVVAHSPEIRQGWERYASELEFTRQYLATRPSATPLTIYAYWGRIDYIWFDLRARAYFDWLQIVGVIFNKGTASEGQRRAKVAGAFELERFYGPHDHLSPFMQPYAKKLLGRESVPKPGRGDLETLCQDPALDLAVLQLHVADLAVASNGLVSIYDCRALRQTGRITTRTGGEKIASIN